MPPGEPTLTPCGVPEGTAIELLKKQIEKLGNVSGLDGFQYWVELTSHPIKVAFGKNHEDLEKWHELATLLAIAISSPLGSRDWHLIKEAVARQRELLEQFIRELEMEAAITPPSPVTPVQPNPSKSKKILLSTDTPEN
jgi:hypothetical protein